MQLHLIQTLLWLKAAEATAEAVEGVNLKFAAKTEGTVGEAGTAEKSEKYMAVDMALLYVSFPGGLPR